MSKKPKNLRKNLSSSKKKNIETNTMLSLDDSSVQGFYESLADGSYKSIVLVLGAGISVSAGIPDFRSPGGLFEAVQKNFGHQFPEVMERPEHLLSRTFCDENPEVWKNQVIPMLRSWKLEDTEPTITHRLLGWLFKQGWLTRVYTQNIDGLELHSSVLSEIPKTKQSKYRESIIQAHGSMRDGTVVLYGDSLPDRFFQACNDDFKSPKKPVDLVLVMGTSLQVAPFCAIPNMVPKEATRILVDPFPNRVISMNPWSVTSTKLGGRQVKLCSFWGKSNSPWKHELLIQSTSDNFVRQFFENPGPNKKGWSLLSELKVEEVEVLSKGKWHLCHVISKNNDKITVRRVSDRKQVVVSERRARRKKSP